NPSISADTLVRLRRQYGLDQAVAVRYARWLESLLKGEWGFSMVYHRPAGPLVWERARNTLLLTASATLVAWVIALSVAVWVTLGRTWRGLLLGGCIAALLALPDVLLILGLILAAAHTGWLPAGGMTSLDHACMSPWSKFRDVALHLVLPGAALVLAVTPVLLAHTRAALAEVMTAPFITAARAFGIRRTRLIVCHALPVAANPLITLAGFSLGTLLSSSLLVEAMTGWPGLGQLLWQSILQRDYYVVIGAVMFSAILLVTGNLVADLSIYALDPRIKREG
ncbi:MAG: ABC transporter permease, partial [Bryobacteraceae bacterium]